MYLLIPFSFIKYYIYPAGTRSLFPRFISFEIDHGGRSARQGCRRERCQPGTAVRAARRSDQSQNRTATRRADWSAEDFLLRFLISLFNNEGPRQGHIPRRNRHKRHKQKRLPTAASFTLVFGGGGGNRTPVRKHSALGPTCLVSPLI